MGIVLCCGEGLCILTQQCFINIYKRFSLFRRCLFVCMSVKKLLKKLMFMK